MSALEVAVRKAAENRRRSVHELELRAARDSRVSFHELRLDDEMGVRSAVCWKGLRAGRSRRAQLSTDTALAGEQLASPLRIQTAQQIAFAGSMTSRNARKVEDLANGVKRCLN
jgi:hypothetical protein